MNYSGLNLIDLRFLRTRVEVNEESETKDASKFDFNGSMLGWGLEHDRVEDVEDTWWVGLAFATHKAPESGPVCPYVVDIQAIGVFRVDSSVEESSREEFVVECGAGIIYGGIREMVSNITARSAAGPLLIPTVSFKGTLKESTNAGPQRAKKKAPKKKRAADR